MSLSVRKGRVISKGGRLYLRSNLRILKIYDVFPFYISTSRAVSLIKELREENLDELKNYVEFLKEVGVSSYTIDYYSRLLNDVAFFEKEIDSKLRSAILVFKAELNDYSVDERIDISIPYGFYAIEEILPKVYILRPLRDEDVQILEKDVYELDLVTWAFTKARKKIEVTPAEIKPSPDISITYYILAIDNLKYVFESEPVTSSSILSYLIRTSDDVLYSKKSRVISERKEVFENCVAIIRSTPKKITIITVRNDYMEIKIF